MTTERIQRQLDIAGIDADGEVVVAVEVGRLNHDYRREVLEDFDKMAACDVEEAIWIVMTQDDAHELLEVLDDPVEGEPRVDKTYSKTTRVPQLQIETAGLTDIRMVDRVLKLVDETPDPRSA